MTQSIEPGARRANLYQGAGEAAWLMAVRWYVAGGAVGHLLWEFAHVPLYTLWETASQGEIVRFVLHCWVGDLLILETLLIAAWFLPGTNGWPVARDSFRRVTMVVVLLGIGYTIFSEWRNVEVLRAWAYRPMMPRVPGLGIGVSPLLQWIIVPSLALMLTRRRGLRA